MLQSPDSEVWIKGWFDGDYNAIPGFQQQSKADAETTRVQITRGRLTAVERVKGPPVGVASLRQEVLAEAQLQAPYGQAWITSLQDLHIVDWESDSTASLLGGGGPRVGRLVGWAYARVIDPRLNTRQKRIEPSSLSTRDSAPASNDSSQISSTSSAFLVSEPWHGPSASVDSVNQPLHVHPCRVCSWGRALLVFLAVWMVCSIAWAFLAIAPLLMRCFLARFVLSLLSSNENVRLRESILLVILGASAFGYVVWRVISGCGDIPIAALVMLFTLVPWSVRTSLCWVIGLLGWMWVLAVLVTCPAQDGACRNTPNISSAANQLVSDAQNKLNQIFRPDRDAHDISGQTSKADGWTRISVDEAEKHPDKFFSCTEKSGPRRDQHVIYMGESALFELNQTTLGEASEPQLARIGKLIKKYPSSNLIVVGHADKSPHRDGPEGNLALSERRAYAVVDWLMTGGYVKPDHIVGMGAGDRYPLFDSPGEFRGNRRVEIRIVCPGTKP